MFDVNFHVVMNICLAFRMLLPTFSGCHERVLWRLIICAVVLSKTSMSISGQSTIRTIIIEETDSVYLKDIDHAVVRPDGQQIGVVERTFGGRRASLIDLPTGLIRERFGPSYDLADSVAQSTTCASLNERNRLKKHSKTDSGAEYFRGTDYYYLVPSRTWYPDSSRLNPSWIESVFTDMLLDEVSTVAYGTTSVVGWDTVAKQSGYFIVGVPNMLEIRSNPYRRFSSALSIDRRDYGLKRDSVWQDTWHYEVVAYPENRICKGRDAARVLMPLDLVHLVVNHDTNRPRSNNLLHGEVDPVTMDVQPGLYYPVAPRIGDVERHYLSVIPCVSRNHGYRYVINGLPWVYDRNGRALFELDTQGLSFLPVALQDSVTTSVFRRYGQTRTSTVIELSENAAGETLVILRVNSPNFVGKSDILVQRYGASGTLLRSHRFATTSASEYACATYHAPGDTVFIVSFRNDTWIIEEVRL